MADYVIYCDESRHDGPQANRFMAIGSLWVDRQKRDLLTREVQAVRSDAGLLGEIKWQKVSRERLEAYKKIVDLFFNRDALQFRVIVVDQGKVDLQKFHDGDAELGFYKFYYELLEKWIDEGNEYLVLLDFKQNRGATRYADFRRILRNRADKIGARIKDLTVIDSKQAPLAQVCDLITGAVAAECCEDIARQSAKHDLANYIQTKAGVSFRRGTTSPARCKLNVFHIRLS